MYDYRAVARSILARHTLRAPSREEALSPEHILAAVEGRLPGWDDTVCWKDSGNGYSALVRGDGADLTLYVLGLYLSPTEYLVNEWETYASERILCAPLWDAKDLSELLEYLSSWLRAE